MGKQSVLQCLVALSALANLVVNWRGSMDFLADYSVQVSGALFTLLLIWIIWRIDRREWDMDRFKKSDAALPILCEMKQRSREDKGPKDRFLARRIRKASETAEATGPRQPLEDA